MERTNKPMNLTMNNDTSIQENIDEYFIPSRLCALLNFRFGNAHTKKTFDPDNQNKDEIFNRMLFLSGMLKNTDISPSLPSHLIPLYKKIQDSANCIQVSNLAIGKMKDLMIEEYVFLIQKFAILGRKTYEKKATTEYDFDPRENFNNVIESTNNIESTMEVEN